MTYCVPINLKRVRLILNIFYTLLFLTNTIPLYDKGEIISMKKIIFTFITCLSLTCYSKEITVPMYQVTSTGIGSHIGTVTLQDSKDGLVIETNLNNFPAGPHGFHIHEFASCDPQKDKNGIMQAALAAGNHYDPHHTNHHAGPNGNGHLGDLPYLSVSEAGTNKIRFLMKNITVHQLKNKSLIIHENTDNYKDIPLPQGGSGLRIGCGIIP